MKKEETFMAAIQHLTLVAVKSYKIYKAVLWNKEHTKERKSESRFHWDFTWQFCCLQCLPPNNVQLTPNYSRSRCPVQGFPLKAIKRPTYPIFRITQKEKKLWVLNFWGLQWLNSQNYIRFCRVDNCVKLNFLFNTKYSSSLYDTRSNKYHNIFTGPPIQHWHHRLQRGSVDCHKGKKQDLNSIRIYKK